MKNIKLIIEKAITKNGMTQKEVQAKLGMSGNGYYTMLRTNSIKAKDLEALSQILNIPVSDFFDEEHEREHPDQETKVFLSFEIRKEIKDQVINMVMGKECPLLLK